MASEHRIVEKIVIIPAYQPGGPLIEVVAGLSTSGLICIVVDDGSGRDYRKVFDHVENHAVVLRHDKNLGKGAALKTGYRYIKETFGSGIIITADADGQHTVSDINKLADAYMKSDNPSNVLMIGARKFSQADVPLRSRIGNIITTRLFRTLTGLDINDTQTGLRAFDYSLIDLMLDIDGDRFEYETNVLLVCSKRKISVTEIPIDTIYLDKNKSSHFNPITDSITIYLQIARFIYYKTQNKH